MQDSIRPRLSHVKTGVGHVPCVLYWAVLHVWAKPASPEEASKVIQKLS